MVGCGPLALIEVATSFFIFDIAASDLLTALYYARYLGPEKSVKDKRSVKDEAPSGQTTI